MDDLSSTSTVIAIHVALNIGLGFMLTPLLTSALGSLPKRLYSHGSAIINTLQQVAGAAGTALFITLMTTGTATRGRPSGTSPAGAIPVSIEILRAVDRPGHRHR